MTLDNKSSVRVSSVKVEKEEERRVLEAVSLTYTCT